MSKKRAKSAGSAGMQRWEQAILSTPLVEEDKWTASIAFVVGNKLEDSAHIDVLASAVNAGKRKLFNMITDTELYAQVNELGNPKGIKKGAVVPQNYEVCEPCKEYLDGGENIPVALLARLVKFKLLDIKQRDLKRREMEKKSGQEKDKGGKKGDKKERTKSPAKGGKGGKKTPEPQSAKADSKLKKRGEEDLENKYIDDEPDDGPNNYIFVSGFHDPHLISQLNELGIHVDSIVKVTSEDYSRFEKNDDNDDLDLPQEKDDRQIAAEEEAHRLKQKKIKELEQFWKDIHLLLQMAPSGSKLHDVARLDYTVKENIIPEPLEDNELKTKFGADLFEDTACMLYDLVDSKRQWMNYLANLKLINIPLSAQQAVSTQANEPQVVPSQTPAAGAVSKAAPTEGATQTESETKPSLEGDMRYYNDMMKNIPEESVSVPLIMHCMLEQIEASEEDRDILSETPRAPRTDGVEENLARHIGSVAFKLALTEEDQSLLQEFDAPKKQEAKKKQPDLLNFRDQTATRLRHLKPVNGFDPMKSELEMLGYTSISSVRELPSVAPRETVERVARLQELLHFCATGATAPSEVDHALQQFVLESLSLTGADTDGNVNPPPKSPQLDIPWDDPYPFYMGMIPKPEDGSRCDDPFLDTRSGAKSPLPDQSRNTQDLVREEGSGSRAQSASIMRRSGSAGSTGSRIRSYSAHSVHFERDDEGKLVIQPGDGEEEEEERQMIDDELGVIEDPMEVVNESQKRNLDQWCFAEKLEPHVLLQVLKESQFTHPFLDTYYHQRNNTLMVVLHNPYAESLQNRVEWHCELLSNVGFRNYLEHISDHVTDWTRDEEAKYQATILAKEVVKIQKDADEVSSRPISAKRKDRSKSPKKSPSRSGKSPSRSSSVERPSSSNPYVRTGSLKAYKEEQDRVKAEEEEKERQKHEKRARSAQKKASKEHAELEAKEKKRPGSRSSSRNKMAKEEAPVEDKPEEPQGQEPYSPFQGYDVENELLHIRGTVSSMFPADGGHIRTEKYEFVHGTVGVKSTVLKDGHTFSVHVLDPKSPTEQPDETVNTLSTTEDGQEKADLEKSEKEDICSVKSGSVKSGSVSLPADGSSDGQTPRKAPEEPPQPKKPCVGQFGSFTAQMNDGMSLSLSTYGADGQPVNGEKYEPAVYVAPPPRSPSPTGKDASPGKGKKDKNKDKNVPVTPEPTQQEEEQKEEVKEEIKVPEQPFQQLCLTSPDGLQVSYFLESSVGIPPEDPTSCKLLVRQSYPFPTSGTSSLGEARQAAMEEVSRVVNRHGTVIKTMKDNTVQIFYANGGVSQFCLTSALVSVSRSSSPQRVGSAHSDHGTPTKKKERQSRSAKKRDAQPEVTVEEPVVAPGYWISTNAHGERVGTTLDGGKVAVKDALVCKATDPQTKQVMYTRDDNTIIVHHPNSTTIVEHSDGTRITTFISEVKVSVPSEQTDETGETSEVETRQIPLVQVECPGFATLRFNTESSECSTDFGNDTMINTFIDGSYDVFHCDGGHLRLSADGMGFYWPRPNNDLEQMDPNQELQYTFSHFSDSIVEFIDNQGNNFSVSNTGETQVMMASGEQVLTEEEEQDYDNIDPVFQTKTITQYKQHAPKFFIINPDGSGTELLRYQDVSEYIAVAEDDLSTAILMDPLPDYPGVLGITIMRPYQKDISQKWIKKYVENSIMPPGLLSRDLSTIPPKEQKLEGPSFGSDVGRGLAVGSLVKSLPQPPVLKCPSALEIRQLLQFKPVMSDLREKLSSGLQKYADYVKMRTEDSDSLQVLDPRSEDEQILAADLYSQNKTDDNSADVYERATAAPLPSPPPTPQSKRTQADWDKDARDLAQEQEARRALREHDVPPYFESELGKAFILTQAPDMESLAKHLSDDPRTDESRAIRSSSNTPQSQDRELTRLTSTDYTINVPQTRTDQTGSELCNHDDSPPVTLSANHTAEPPTPSININDNRFEETQYQEESESDSRRDNVKYNVIGEPRGDPIRVPAYVHSGRPSAEPNTQFTEVEDPVRRKTYTTSITGATAKGSVILNRMRGFDLLPDMVEFGVLREGSSYGFTVFLKNTGVDSCRFKVKQPPPSTGMKILYQPGPVAAGMKAELVVEVYAIAAGVKGDRGVGMIDHELEIVTETDVLKLPIKATVLTANEYDERDPVSPKRNKGPGVQLISNKCPNNQGIIRPRKESTPPHSVQIKSN